MDSPSSSELLLRKIVAPGAVRAAARTSARGLGLIGLFALVACSTVRPEEKEFLAQPSMTFGSGGEDAAQEDHVISNREGSYGGGGVSGGGCGCN